MPSSPADSDVLKVVLPEGTSDMETADWYLASVVCSFRHLWKGS